MWTVDAQLQFHDIKRMWIYLFPTIGLILLVSTACGPAEPTERIIDEDPNQETTSEGDIITSNVDPDVPYPAPAVATAAYPAPRELVVIPTISAYPGPEEERPDESEWFRFDLPLEPGMSTVTGQAPPNLELAIVDVTYAGEILGTGDSDQDGRFAINVTSIPQDHRIGIALAELEPGVKFEDKVLELYPYRGDGYMMIPNVGLFFETVFSEP